MKRLYIIPILLVLFILNGCVSSKKLFESGQYDAAVTHAVKKLRKKKTREKEIQILEHAYSRANQADIERINFLQKEGNPDMWTEIFERYMTLKRRQEQVKMVSPLVMPSSGRKVNFIFVNYDDEIISAKKKAAEYYYAKGVQLLEKNDRFSAREAYSYFIQVKAFYPDYQDVNSKIETARSMGMSYVLFKMQNKTGVPLPPNFEEDLKKISLKEIESSWVTYDTYENKKLDYDFTILLNMKVIDVSPESVKEVRYTEQAEVPDGYQYVLDSKGNVMKDSLGNDIKVPKKKVITCNVVETLRHKQAIIGGTLDYYNNSTGQLIKTDPVTTETFFDNASAVAFGDINALKPETRKKLSSPPVPFPNDFGMIMQAGETLKGMVKGIIFNNKHLLH